MRNLKTLILCLCLILLNSGVLQANEPHRNLTEMVVPFVKNDSPDVVGIVKDFSKRIFRVKQYSIDHNLPPEFKSFTIIKDERFCSETSRILKVSSYAEDGDGDTILYTYKVSAGKIVGNERTVDWDLFGVKAGTYTITFEVDDGCGCVKPVTREITIVENSDCKNREN